WAHKTRNILDKVKKKDQLAVKKALNRISHASNRREAAKAYWRFFFPLDKELSPGGGLLKEKLRSALKLLSDQKLSTVESIENHQLNRKSVSGSQTKNSPDGCDGSYPEPTKNRFRCVSSLKSEGKGVRTLDSYYCLGKCWGHGPAAAD
ncbi:MAG TPA: hypothetical protein VGA01_02475, partial [Candidatus Binatia bacterium]